MSSKDAHMTLQVLNAGKNYFEYGTGGSTRLALMSTIEKIVAIDSDAAWIKKLSEEPIVAKAINSSKITLKHVDIGPVKAWGWPVSEDSKSLWPNYVNSIDSISFMPDVVLVDGRFRAACALKVFMKYGRSVLVVIHDFFERLSAYGVVFEFADEVSRCDSLVVLRVKEKVDQAGLERRFGELLHQITR
jgi:hypothetical protein